MAARQRYHGGDNDPLGASRLQEHVIGHGEADQDQAAQGINPLARKAIGEDAEDRDGDELRRGRHINGQKSNGAVNFEHVAGVSDEIDGEEIKAGVLADAGAGGQQDLAPVSAQRLADRCPGDQVFFFQLREQRRFHYAKANHQPDDNQQPAQIKRNPPAPIEECRLLQIGLAQRHNAVGHEEPERHACLRPTGVEAAPTAMAVLDREQHSPAPLTADADALDHSEHAEQERRGHADPVRGW